MPLFEVAIIEVPTAKEVEDGATDKLVFGPKPVMAKDTQSAAIAAVLSGETPKINMTKAQVLVRPFV